MAVVAIVGLGIMGRGMAANLAREGHEVVLWNRSQLRPEVLSAIPADARMAATPAEAARRADAVFEVTADDGSSRAVWLGPEGILAGARPGTVLITSATLSVDWIAELAAACAKQDLPFLDMPVTGGAEGARTGNLTMLAGGDAALLSGLDPVLGAVARQVRHFGPVGAGTRFKLVLNTLQAVHMAAFGEAMRLAAEAGLDLGQVGAALLERPGGVVTKLAHDNLVSPPDPINFSAEWARKDLDYASRLAGPDGYPFLDAVLGAFTRVVAEGRGGEDWSVVNRPAS
ncbi:NAD(P)-dependent oxidoreductase [Nonomuraea roseoviolacea]|uniref:3-hydroxyisobutyrate dehydrogenase-like beta-hydroxyacid dehydrogenase n=1 Tax=Nonomuraea roseoviolacea subsp. carminata TaxID=160689 RepID=A0ABT1K8J4_9ACTN|nr:NAD(P)-dependent oxidoreductase [Nonomuraea roseoviolacea]MCP2350306.1 3-hydroxyisobutyrate dehydrogenase-like beta-hydroxyacid dehydrogenase [Nonomuraea roseoviolacea subsp. carminata]